MSVQYTSEGTRPMSNTRETPARIDAWCAFDGAGPEEVHLSGRISAHPHQERLRTAHQITTCIIEAPTHWPWHEGDIVRTLNTWYVLGEPQEEHDD